MTDEERKLALYCLKASSDYHSEVCEECIKYPNCDHTGQDDVTETIIQSLEQEPCEDVIDRAEAMTEIMMFVGNVKSDEEDIYIKVSDAVQLLRDLPSVTPQQKKGHWIVEIWNNREHHTCSVCQTVVDYEPCYHYCPYCGAEMEVENED